MSVSYEEKTVCGEDEVNRFFIGSGINRFGERLKSAMDAKGITSNVKMGSLCNMSDTVIRNYLIGKTYPTLDRLATLAYVLDSSPEWLLTGSTKQDDNGNQHKEITETSNIKNEMEGVEFVFRKLSKTQRDVLLSAILEYGVVGIMTALNGMSTVSDFLQLSEAERARVLRVYEQIKEGASHGDQDAAQRSLISCGKQAG